jgi:hypothetical protein
LKALYSIANAVACTLIDMIDKGNMTGAVAATNHHLSAIEERLIRAPPVLVIVMDRLIGLTKRMSV